MNRSWLFVCFATLRLLQCFTCTIFALLVSFNLSCFATILIILSILSISVSDHNRPWMLLIVSCVQLCPQKSVGNCRYEYPLWLSRSLVTWNTWLHERPTSIRMDTRSIVQSPNHSRFYRIIWQNLLSLYNSRMQKQDISQDLMCLHRTTFAFERANFVVRILFSKAIISATVYDTNLNLSMARSACAPIVKGPLTITLYLYNINIILISLWYYCTLHCVHKIPRPCYQVIKVCCFS